MKRRLFLKGLLSASAVATVSVPVIVEAVTEPEFKILDEEQPLDIKPLAIKRGNTLITPEQIANDALEMLKEHYKG